jgi:hypothetical protein
MNLNFGYGFKMFVDHGHHDLEVSIASRNRKVQIFLIHSISTLTHRPRQDSSFVEIHHLPAYSLGRVFLNKKAEGA